MHQIKKFRYCIMENNRYCEIVIYTFSKSNAICDIEVNGENEQASPPDYIKLKREVPDDKSFSNHSIAKQILPNLY